MEPMVENRRIEGLIPGYYGTEYKDTGEWKVNHVYAGRQLIGDQERVTYPQTTGVVFWRYQNPITGEEINSPATGYLIGETLLDPLGADLITADPFPPDGSGAPNGDMPPPQIPAGNDTWWPYPMDGFRVGCEIDSIVVDCEFAKSIARNGAVEAAPTKSVWAHDRWNLVSFDPTTGQYGIRPGGEFFEPLPSNSFFGIGFRGVFLVGVNPTGVTTGLDPQDNVRTRDIDYARSAYQGDLGKTLTRCINKIYSKYVDYEHGQRKEFFSTKRKVGKGSDLLEYQRLSNAPNILFEDMGPTTMGGTHPYDYRRGIVRISDHLIKTFEDGQRTYVHELGNYLSTKIDGQLGLLR
jgi:hypothetical protein